jgi:CRISPR system Cascade subunit CasA
MHLINDAWFPIRKRDGSRHRIRPCEIVDVDTVDVDAPRADLAVAARTFLIGLVTTAGLADIEKDWRRLYDKPPTFQTLMKRLRRYSPAFELLSDEPRFCQYHAVVEEGDRQRVATLLIDGPTEESDARNFDIMTDVLAFSPTIAALALYALQQLAPSGGRGYRQSMRRGSPMATLVNGGSTLWHSIWLNAETREQVAARSPKRWKDEPKLGDIFPWMGRVRTSETGLETTTSDAHPLQVYWQMPRLLWLDASPAGDDRCGLTGESGDVLVRGYYRTQRGISYSRDWRHPHVPHISDKRKGIIPVEASARASRIGEWLGIVYRDQHGDREPAAVVTTAVTHRAWSLSDASARVDVFGIEMRSAKVIGAISHVMPIITVDPIAADELRAAIERTIRAVELVAETLFKTSKAALIGPETRDAVKRTAVKDAEEVKAAFLTAMERHVEGSILAASAEIRAQTFDPAAHARNLLGIVRHQAETAFDSRLPTYTWVNGMERRVRRRWELAIFLNGKSKASAGLLEILQLPMPGSMREKKDAA